LDRRQPLQLFTEVLDHDMQVHIVACGFTELSDRKDALIIRRENPTAGSSPFPVDPTEGKGLIP
jgi:hypothetical protein